MSKAIDHWHLRIVSKFKNYEGELDALFKLLEPYIIANKNEVLGQMQNDDASGYGVIKFINKKLEIEGKDFDEDSLRWGY